MELERDFKLWLDRQDADGLGRVFDAVGGKLLLLATHLAGPGQLAQDLVQSTFLAAMARGESWQRNRPLWPWLAGILQNEARMHRRRNRRRREVAIDATQVVDDVASAAVVGDPGNLAASQEVLGAVLTAIDGMSVPYRQVLRLRLVHGLRPVDIARSLEVPVGTVRAQLHRGLEQLRGVLPAGVAGMVGVLLAGDGALLAQVRQSVLQAAGSPPVAVAGAIGLGGWLSMNAKMIVGVAAGLVVLACLGLAVGTPTWFAVDAPPEKAAQPAAATPPAAPLAGPGERSQELTREAVPAATVPTWPLTVTVTTNAASPVPGAEVRVWTAPHGFAYWNRDSSVFRREILIRGVTDGDGVFRSSLDALLDRSLVLLRTQGLWVEARWPHGRARQELVALPRSRDSQKVEVAIELRRSAGIVGRVVASDGSEVVRADMRTILDGRLSGSEATTREDGTFFVEVDRDPEYWPDQLGVVHARCGTVVVAVPPRQGPDVPVDVGTIVLPTENVVHGRLELGDGSALAGIQIGLQSIDPSLGDDRKVIRKWLMDQRRKNTHVAMRDGRVVVVGMQTNTEADGSFRFAGLDPDATYYLSLRMLRASVDAIVKPGAEPVRLRVDGQLLTVEVVDQQGNEAVGVELSCAGYDPDSKTPSWSKHSGFPEVGQVCSNYQCYGDPDGRRVLLTPFGLTWRIGTSGDAVQPTFARHEAFAGVYRATCRMVVRAESSFGKLHIVAVDEQGEPIRFGAALKAVDRLLEHNNRRMIAPPEGRTWDLPVGKWNVRTVLGKEVIYLMTDEGYARGFQDHVVTIVSGKTTELKVVAKPAGLVAFRLHSKKMPKSAWAGLRIELDGRVVDLLAHDRDPFRSRTSKTSDLPVMFVTRQAVPPGKQRFLVHADGYQVAVCDVDVVVDKLNTVRVELLTQ